MDKKSTYQLYVGNQCNSCERVVSYVDGMDVSISIINIDEEDYDLPFSLMIIPALVKENKLIGYGPDIQKHFDLKST